ncbi:hypothetical protein QTO34_007831 [Cnephaeus nilssonii]|uniref:Uncharacterized protein n=1 Tax=Cnephaeus nilssonii TaxID=3371016 RepID=A0AA40LGU0_CNENI|nr:hypothetical protein QTO34_007831 [Eptesicus nilssonii]
MGVHHCVLHDSVEKNAILVQNPPASLRWPPCLHVHSPRASIVNAGEEMCSLRCEKQDGKASKERGLWHQLVDHKPGSELTTSGRVCFLIFEAFSSP